eukprot:2190366-Pleurochrysis_carterae.AAC.1
MLYADYADPMLRADSGALVDADSGADGDNDADVDIAARLVKSHADDADAKVHANTDANVHADADADVDADADTDACAPSTSESRTPGIMLSSTCARQQAPAQMTMLILVLVDLRWWVYLVGYWVAMELLALVDLYEPHEENSLLRGLLNMTMYVRVRDRKALGCPLNELMTHWKSELRAFDDTLSTKPRRPLKTQWRWKTRYSCGDGYGRCQCDRGGDGCACGHEFRRHGDADGGAGGAGGAGELMVLVMLVVLVAAASAAARVVVVVVVVVVAAARPIKKSLVMKMAGAVAVTAGGVCTGKGVSGVGSEHNDDGGSDFAS